jgi:hypothetical protein
MSCIILKHEQKMQMDKQHSHRSKSTHIALLCCLVTVLSICCQQQAEITDDTPSLLQDKVDIEVLVNDDMGGSYVTAGLAKNNSDKLYTFHIKVLYYDNRDRLIGTQSGLVSDLYPGTEQAFFILTADDWSHAARADVKITNIVSAEETSITPDFEFGNISVYHHQHGTQVLGEVINRDDAQYSIGILGAVFDENGELMKANSHAVRNLYPGETRMFAAGVLGEDTYATDGRVYLESIIEVMAPQTPPNITFSNLRMAYNSDIDRTSVQCDIANHDERGYRNIMLLIGVYEDGNLIRVTWTSMGRIGPGEITPFNQMLFDGNFEGQEVKIQIDSIEPDE